MPEKLKQGMRKCFEKLEEEPFLIVEPLHGALKGKWKTRVGYFRVIMEINHDLKLIKIIFIGPRGDIYK